MARPGRKGNRRPGLFPRLLSSLLQGLLGSRYPKIFYGFLEQARSRASESALQHRLDLLVEFIERRFALDDFAIDEEGRRRIHLEHVGGVLLIGGDLVEQRLVLE